MRVAGTNGKDSPDGRLDRKDPPAVGAPEEALTAFTFDKSYDALRLALHRESGLRPEFRRRAQHPRRGA